jgi:dihydrofolate reductase
MNFLKSISKAQIGILLSVLAIAISGCGGSDTDTANIQNSKTAVVASDSASSLSATADNQPSADALALGSFTAEIALQQPATTDTSSSSKLQAFAAESTLKAGIISYWGETASYYEQLPAGALALVNPDNGIFISAGQTTRLPNLSGFQSIVSNASDRGVDMLGYVPTGYFKHNCNKIGVCQTWSRIDAQVKAYFLKFPTLKGIFFDEASPAVWNCAAFPAEYKRLRSIVAKYKAGAKIVFNAGVPDNCAVAGVNAGEIIVLFEDDLTNYQAQTENITVSTQTALAKGAIPWHLVHTVKSVDDMQKAAAQARAAGTTYFYSTDIGGNWQAGENTWGSLPKYWTEELKLFTNYSPSLRAGVISYWGEDASIYNQLPAGALALINPDSGIFVADGQTTTLPDLTGFKSIASTASARGVNILGYVPTGYFNHTCNQYGVCQTWDRIDAQVKAYFANFPTLKGIFFDETSPTEWNCAAFPAEYQRLRNIVNKYKPGATMAFNAGVPDNCVVAGVNAGEIVVLFENDLASYEEQFQNITDSTKSALAKGAIPWHLVHTVKTTTEMRLAADLAKTAGTTYFYTTDIGGNWQAGENTWGTLPKYWIDELRLFQ